MHRSVISLAIVFGAATRSSAQSPRVTPAGDPSVKSDTIYSLAVKPADYADQPYVYLLDDGIVKLEADGTRNTHLSPDRADSHAGGGGAMG